MVRSGTWQDLVWQISHPSSTCQIKFSSYTVISSGVLCHSTNPWTWLDLNSQPSRVTYSSALTTKPPGTHHHLHDVYITYTHTHMHSHNCPFYLPPHTDHAHTNVLGRQTPSCSRSGPQMCLDEMTLYLVWSGVKVIIIIGQGSFRQGVIFIWVVTIQNTIQRTKHGI